MADLEQMLREVFGESFSKLANFQGEQVKKFQGKLQEIAHEAMKDEVTRLNTELAELRNRVTLLERERAQKAAEGLEPSF